MKKDEEVLDILRKLENKNSIITTSAGSTSLVLIDLLNRSGSNIPVVFIDTGFLFEETKTFFESFKTRYPNLEFITLSSGYEKSDFFKNNVIENTNYCCKKNKVDLLRDFLFENKVEFWISGPRRDQTEHRKNMQQFEKSSTGITKVYPMLDWTEFDFINYINKYNLTYNPLYFKGYDSIGCYPCTKVGNGRTGRWEGEKTECGLHL